MKELYAGEPVAVNAESLASWCSSVHHEALGPFFNGSLGEGLSNFQAPRPPCTRPYTAIPLSKP